MHLEMVMQPELSWIGVYIEVMCDRRPGGLLTEELELVVEEIVDER
jgi:hypothetical protein